jgi:hypothetical protein
MAYRMEYSGRTLVYLTDHEPGWLMRAAVAMKEDTETDSEGWVTYREAMDKKPTGGQR